MNDSPTPFRKKARIVFLGVFFLLVCLLYVSRLVNMQIANPEFFAGSGRTYTEKAVIQAVRGEIFDRNGNKLAANEYHYDLAFDQTLLPKQEETVNASLDALFTLLSRQGRADLLLPSLSRNDAFYAFLSQNGLEKDILTKDLMAFLFDRYAIDESLPCRKEIALIRYEWETSHKNTESPYPLLSDLDVSLIGVLEEADIRGLTILKRVVRVYPYAGYASHVLGTTGKIHREDLAYYSELGYPMDAIVGVSGAEKAFESILHGTDGTLALTLDKNGRVIDQKVTKEPVAGQDVYLTLDIELQIAAEKALAENIESIRTKGLNSGKALNGDDCRTGALAAVDPRDNSILVLASYPSYDLNTYYSDYASLLADPDTPLLNRSLSGTYAPGSVFKPAVAAAALENGIITPYDRINDTGVYDYYAPSYSPRCWYYSYYGRGHGEQNVTVAIMYSCNYFFYDIGRRLGIERMNAYCKQLGLGQATGIELYEEKGTLAGPESREISGLGIWNPGDTLQAAIGQIENAFTPLQMSVYMSALLNGGTRYEAHLFDHAATFYRGEVTSDHQTQVLSQAQMSESTVSVIKNAMKSVMEDGTASRLFANYEIATGGKTGTAQVSAKKSNNAVLSVFAPFDQPEIVVTCIIEQGVNGTDAGPSVKAVLDRYFSVGSYAEE